MRRLGVMAALVLTLDAHATWKSATQGGTPQDIDVLIAHGDATSGYSLFVRDGRLWLAAGSQTLAGTRAGSSWDALSLFFADRLEGPWTPHPMNPVVVDVRGARPAGELFEADGALWRPSQDCSRGYGSALMLCRVERLTTEDYAETPTAHLAVPGTERAAAGSFGPHTLNSAGGYEAIDIFSPPSSRP